MYEKQVAHYRCALSVVWKIRNEIDILQGSGPLGSGPTGPGSDFSVMPPLMKVNFKAICLCKSKAHFK